MTPAHYKILGLKLAFVIIFEVYMIGQGPKFVLYYYRTLNGVWTEEGGLNFAFLEGTGETQKGPGISWGDIIFPTGDSRIGLRSPGGGLYPHSPVLMYCYD